MMPRLILALFAFGFLLQSCTLQKRTLMPGWHLERVGQASTYDDVERPEPLPDLNTGESVLLAEAAPAALYPLIPVKALMAFSPPMENSAELQMPHNVFEANMDANQPAEEVASSSGVESTEPSGEEPDKKRQRTLVTIAALLGVGAIVALDLSATPTIGLVLIAIALTALRFAFPYAKPESSEQPPDQKEGRGKRIAMGVLAVGLGFASGMAIAFGLFGQFWPLVVLGVGLGLLALRALVVAVPNAFPRLRALMTKRS